MGRPRCWENPVRAEEAHRREKGRTMSNPNWERTSEERKMCPVHEKIAMEVGAESIASGALSLKTRVRDAEQLLTSCDCVPLDITLSAEQIQRIESANSSDLGFPYTLILVFSTF